MKTNPPKREKKELSKTNDGMWMEEKNGKDSLLFLLSGFTRDGLKELAKELGLRGCSAYRKQELLAAITEYLSNEENVQSFFMNCLDEEITFFEACVEGNVKIDEETVIPSLYFFSKGYCFPEGECFLVPEEIRQIYKGINNKEFRNIRKRYLEIVFYCRAACNLYGTIPCEKFIEIFNSQNDEKLDKDEFREMTALSEKRNWGFEIQEGLITDFSLYRNGGYKVLMEEQRDKPYYIPEKEQFLKYVDGGYFEETKAYRRLQRFLIKELRAEKRQAEKLCKDLYFDIYGGCEIQDLLEEIDDAGVRALSEDQALKIFPYLNDLWNETRMLVNRGFTPNEMSLLMDGVPEGVRKQKKEPESKVIPFPIERRRKK